MAPGGIVRKLEHESLERVNSPFISGPFIAQTDVGPASEPAMTQAKDSYQAIQKEKHG